MQTFWFPWCLSPGSYTSSRKSHAWGQESGASELLEQLSSAEQAVLSIQERRGRTAAPLLRQSGKMLGEVCHLLPSPPQQNWNSQRFISTIWVSLLTSTRGELIWEAAGANSPTEHSVVVKSCLPLSCLHLTLTSSYLHLTPTNFQPSQKEQHSANVIIPQELRMPQIRDAQPLGEAQKPGEKQQLWREQRGLATPATNNSLQWMRFVLHKSLFTWEICIYNGCGYVFLLLPLPSSSCSIIPTDFPFLFTLCLVCPRNISGYATKSSEKELSLTKLLLPLCSQAHKLTAPLIKHRLKL